MKYHDGSFLTGNFGRGNRFHGLVRYFDSKVKLQGIISVEKREISKEDVSKNDFLWKRMDKQELENFIMLKSFNKDRIFIMNLTELFSEFSFPQLLEKAVSTLELLV